MKKHLKKEHKGATKELRKDASFLARARFEEEEAERGDIKEKGARALKFLEGVDTDFKSGGQRVPKKKLL